MRETGRATEARIRNRILNRSNAKRAPRSILPGNRLPKWRTQSVALNLTQLAVVAERLIPLNRPFMVVGKPGVGKTDAIKQAAKKLGRKLYVSMPAIDAPEDYKGFGFFTRDNDGNGQADFHPMGQIREILEETEPAIWFIDDLGQAPVAVQNAIMQFVHHRSRQLNGKEIPRNVAIVAATNGREHNAGVVGMTDPLKGRFTTIIHVEADIKSWNKWALANAIDPLIIAYLAYRPGNLCDFKASKDFDQSPTPRGWESLNELLKLDLPQEIKSEVFSGALGEHVANEFVQFEAVLNELPPLEQVEMGNCTKMPDTNQARYAVCGALAVRGRDPKSLTNVMNYVDKMPNEYIVLWSELWSERNKLLTETAEWTSWVLKQKDVLMV